MGGTVTNHKLTGAFTTLSALGRPRNLGFAIWVITCSGAMMDEGGVGEGYMGTGAAVIRDLLLLSGAAESCGLPRPHAWVVPIEFDF